ncbi:hypothetical protein M6B38_144475 [Iris pallida]|uniref:Uncharacterized protein n=1 Tax=Iris pallida TaxID=29817 RepID=A0AAX6FAA5_IRIPA|nr:hypothetical protein M6B38_144475 [Iris pallida]
MLPYPFVDESHLPPSFLLSKTKSSKLVGGVTSLAFGLVKSSCFLLCCFATLLMLRSEVLWLLS